jgi:hypothetical protein
LAGFLALALLLTKTRKWSALLADTTIFGALALSGPFTSWLIWPDLLNRLSHSPQATGFRPEYASLEHFMKTIFPLTHSSFWGRFGWMNVLMDRYSLMALDTIGLIGLIVSAAVVWRSWSQLTLGQRLSILVLLVGLVLVSILFVIFNLTNLQPQGRFFFPAMTAICIFVSLGVGVLGLLRFCSRLCFLSISSYWS